MLAANVVRSPGCHGFSISRLRTRLDRGNFPQACHTWSQPSHRVQLAIPNRNSVMPCEFLQHLGLRATMLPGFWTTFRRYRLRGLPVPGCHPQERSLRGQMHQPECVSVRLTRRYRYALARPQPLVASNSRQKGFIHQARAGE